MFGGVRGGRSAFVRCIDLETACVGMSVMIVTPHPLIAAHMPCQLIGESAMVSTLKACKNPQFQHHDDQALEM